MPGDCLVGDFWVTTGHRRPQWFSITCTSPCFPRGLIPYLTFSLSHTCTSCKHPLGWLQRPVCTYKYQLSVFDRMTKRNGEMKWNHFEKCFSFTLRKRADRPVMYVQCLRDSCWSLQDILTSPQNICVTFFTKSSHVYPTRDHKMLVQPKCFTFNHGSYSFRYEVCCGPRWIHVLQI